MHGEIHHWNDYKSSLTFISSLVPYDPLHFNALIVGVRLYAPPSPRKYTVWCRRELNLRHSTLKAQILTLYYIVEVSR